jgi:Spy/CpxP family protein refolding chaperone
MRVPHLLLAASLLVAGGAALADPGGHGFHHGEEFLRGVSLTDAQREQVRQIEQAGWTQAKSGFEQMRSVHEQIMSRLLSPGSVSEADLAPLVQQEQALRAQMDERRLTAALQIRQVLTPQQLAEAAAKHQQIESLHEQEHQLMQPSDAE